MRKKILWRYKKGKIRSTNLGMNVETKMYYIFIGPNMIYYTSLYGCCGNKKVSWMFDLLCRRGRKLSIRPEDENKPLRLIRNVRVDEVESYKEQQISSYLLDRLLNETKSMVSVLSN